MSDERKKPFWPWIAALLIGLPLMYAATFGPVCWLLTRLERDDGFTLLEDSIGAIYSPIGQWAFWHREHPSGRFLCRYALLGVGDSEDALIPIGWQHYARFSQ